MNQLLGFLFGLLIFAVSIVPFSIDTIASTVKSNRIMTISTEVQQLVSAEGGVTPRVEQLANQYKNVGLNINFTDENGNTVRGKIPAGEKIIITYQADDFETSNSVTSLKR